MINYRYKTLCTNVVDGDTIDCTVDLGFQMSMKGRFRLARINTPEINSPDEKIRVKGQESRQFVVDNLLNKNFEVMSIKVEKYGRYLAEVYIGELNLNDELIRLGLATKY